MLIIIFLMFFFKKKESMSDVGISINNIVDNVYIIAIPKRVNYMKKVMKYYGLKGEFIKTVMKNKLNKVLNYARYGDYSDQNAIWLKNNIEKLILSLSEDAKKCFNLDEATCRYKVNNKKKGFKVGDLKMNEISIPQLYSILASMQGEIDEDSLNILPNKVVRNSTGDLPSWTFAKKHLFCFSPFHQKGGVARSNLYYHGKKNWVIKQVKNKYEVNLRKKNRGEFSSEQDVVFRHYRKIYTSAIKEVFNVLRGLIQTKH